jgi:hypothetical protein
VREDRIQQHPTDGRDPAHVARPLRNLRSTCDVVLAKVVEAQVGGACGADLLGNAEALEERERASL